MTTASIPDATWGVNRAEYFDATTQPKTTLVQDGSYTLGESLGQLLRKFVTLCSSPAYPVGLPDVRRTNPDTTAIVMHRAKTWDFGLPSHIPHTYLSLGLSIATTAYDHLSSFPQVQADLATYAGLCVLFDDGASIIGVSPMQEFPSRFYANQPHLHPVLDRFAEMIRSIGKHFPSFCANAIVVSTMDFVSAELFMKDAADMPLVLGSSNYIKYMRTKDGIDEAFAALMFPLCMFPDPTMYIQAFPEIMEVLHLINDILSHYKEAKAGEITDYVSNHATVYGQTRTQAVAHLIVHMENLFERARKILGPGKAVETFDSMVAGFTQYHLNQERYLLSEILPEYDTRAD